MWTDGRHTGQPSGDDVASLQQTSRVVIVITMMTTTMVTVQLQLKLYSVSKRYTHTHACYPVHIDYVKTIECLSVHRLPDTENHAAVAQPPSFCLHEKLDDDHQIFLFLSLQFLFDCGLDLRQVRFFFVLLLLFLFLKNPTRSGVNVFLWSSTQFIATIRLCLPTFNWQVIDGKNRRKGTCRRIHGALRYLLDGLL